MKSIRLLALLGCTVLAAPSFAQTFSDNWWFTDALTGQTVGGLISGLQNGSGLDAGGLTITVTQSPYADLLGTYTDDWTSGIGSFNSYSASGNLVTFANFSYRNGAGTLLYFGTDPNGSTFYPQLVNGNENAYNVEVGTQFSAAGAVPEPANWALMVAGFGLAGAAMRRRRATVHFA